MKYIKNKGISTKGFNRIANAMGVANKRSGRRRAQESDDVQGLASMLKGVVLLKESVGGNYSDFGGDLDMSEPTVYVAIIHDASGYNPGAALYFDHSSADKALQEAYESLQTITYEQLSPEEMEEMYQTEDSEGYNPVTEAFDGRVFTMTPEEFKQVIEGVTGINKDELSVITFEYPEEDEDDEEDFDIEASRKRIRARRRKAQFSAELPMDEFTSAYAEAALWSSIDIDTGDPLDDDYSLSDLAPETVEKFKQFCASFMNAIGDVLEQAYAATGQDETDAGHDFWLTQNNHGAGFWDGDWEDFGDQLTAAANEFPQVELYPGDDGKLHLM